MIKKSSVRDILRKEVVKAAARLYCADNIKRWGSPKVYGNQIQAVWKMAYSKLAKSHPQRNWLQKLVTTPSADIELKLVLRIPEKQIEIDLPDKDRKLGAIIHAGGKELLLELLNIVQQIGYTNEPIQDNDTGTTGGTL